MEIFALLKRIMETAGKVSPQSTIGKIGNTYAPVAQKVENVVDAMQKGHARHQKAMNTLLKKGTNGIKEYMNALKAPVWNGEKIKAVIDNAADVGKLGKLAEA